MPWHDKPPSINPWLFAGETIVFRLPSKFWRGPERPVKQLVAARRRLPTSSYSRPC